MKKILILILLLSGVNCFSAQSDNFNYSISLNPLNIPNLPGLHSFVIAQDKEKWLVIGGRKDGLHARQPFRSFPGKENNTDIYVIDVSGKKFWSTSIKDLPVNLKEQLQSGNMNFYQNGNTLYITGGYAYSESEDDHVTFPYLTSVSVHELIKAVINGKPVNSFFKQIKDTVFAVTGGQMGKIGNYFYLIGGQRFEGRYNPMGHRTYKQTYVDGIRKFKISNSDTQLSYSDFEIITDQVHLHRRDFNLLPQIFPDGSYGYTVSSGVFQTNIDLPFLYPVDINASGYKPVTSFNQYLSNYHTARVFLFDKKKNQMHTLFFGGISMYYLSGTEIKMDRNVPFVKTISRLTRYADGSLHEFSLPVDMPSLSGANAEFIAEHNLSFYENDIINLNRIKGDSVLIGYIYGGILSTELNPFSRNSNELTSAGNTIYEVRLVKNNLIKNHEIDGGNPFSVKVLKESTSDLYIAELNVPYDGTSDLWVTDKSGKIVFQKTIKNLIKGKQTIEFSDNNLLTDGEYSFNFLFDNKYAFIEKLLIEK